jgi:hypothetical protein
VSKTVLKKVRPEMWFDDENNLIKSKGKVKVHPRTGHEGPEGEV